MSIKYKKISPCIWNDAKFNSMSKDGQLAFIYMLTHPMQTSIGAIRTTIAGLGFERNGLPAEAFTEALDKGLVYASAEAPLIWFPNFLRYNKPESPNVANSWGKSLLDLPNCALLDVVLHEASTVLDELNPKFKEAFLKGFGKGFT